MSGLQNPALSQYGNDPQAWWQANRQQLFNRGPLGPSQSNLVGDQWVTDPLYGGRGPRAFGNFAAHFPNAPSPMQFQQQRPATDWSKLQPMEPMTPPAYDPMAAAPQGFTMPQPQRNRFRT